MSNAGHLLPYEAAQLAASAPSFQQPRTLGKLILLCLAGIMMAASVVSGVIVWSVHDDGVVSPTAEVSAVDSRASMTDRLDNDLKREVQATKLNNLAGPAHSTEPATHSSGSSVASDDQEPLPDESLTSPPASIQNGEALISVQKNEADGVKDRAKASFALEGPPATLVAAASSGLMVDRLESSIAARPPKMVAQDRQANGVVPRHISSRSDAKTANQDTIFPTRPQHKPSLKPLEVAALLPPTVVATSFRPAIKSRETNVLNPARAGLLSSSNAIDGEKHTLMLKRFWGTLVQGMAEAFRNRDTSYQLVMNADSNGDGSDEHRGGGNDYDHHDG